MHPAPPAFRLCAQREDSARRNKTPAGGPAGAKADGTEGRDVESGHGGVDHPRGIPVSAHLEVGGAAAEHPIELVDQHSDGLVAFV